jgi:hypothetical protein
MTDRKIDVAAWLPPGEYARADPVRRAAWLARVAADLRDAKVRQVESGVGADGRPMPRVKPTSRPDGSRDRPLIPHDDASRTIRLLKVTANNRAGVVTFHWNRWTTILGYHAEGEGDPLPRRDVFGTPGRFLRRAKARALADWRRQFPFLGMTLRLERALVARGPGRGDGPVFS